MRVQLRTPLGVRVILLDANDGRRRLFEAMLVDCGYEIAASVADPADLPAVAQRTRPDAVVVNEPQPDGPLFARIAEMDRDDARATVLFAEDDRAETIRSAVHAGVSNYVVVGLNSNRIRAAIDTARAQFEVIADVRRRLADTHRALEDRKVVEKAKGILMRQKGLDEDAAYTLLRQRAMERNIRIAELSRMIIETATLIA